MADNELTNHANIADSFNSPLLASKVMNKKGKRVIEFYHRHNTIASNYEDHSMINSRLSSKGGGSRVDGLNIQDNANNMNSFLMSKHFLLHTKNRASFMTQPQPDPRLQMQHEKLIAQQSRALQREYSPRLTTLKGRGGGVYRNLTNFSAANTLSSAPSINSNLSSVNLNQAPGSVSNSISAANKKFINLVSQPKFKVPASNCWLTTLNYCWIYLFLLPRFFLIHNLLKAIRIYIDLIIFFLYKITISNIYEN